MYEINSGLRIGTVRGNAEGAHSLEKLFSECGCQKRTVAWRSSRYSVQLF